MANKWLAHVKKTMKSNKGMKFGQVLKLAKKTYKKTGGGEGGGPEPAPSSGGPFANASGTGGRRRRRTRRGGMGSGY
jgi:hypothetical protein